MRLRTWLLGFILVSLLLPFPTLAASSAAGYQAAAASLRSLWATDLQSGVSPTQLAPLQAELAATETSSLASLPTIAFNPLDARAEIASLRSRTTAIYLQDLDAARTSAVHARAALTFALAPLTAVQAHMLREVMADAITPTDYTALAAAWLLDAKLVPLDRSLASRQSSLSALVVQADSLSIPTSDATALVNDTTTYLTLSPAGRFATAPVLLARFDPITTSLLSRVNAEIHARASAAEAAQAAARVAALQTAWAATPPWRVRQIITLAFRPLGSPAVTWALRVANCESHYHPNSVNQTSGTTGLFQFMPATWAHTPWAAQSPFNPVANAQAAAWLYSRSGPVQWSCK